MKSERRHELDTNVLAIRLKEWIEKIKPYSRVLTVVAIAVVGGAIAWTYIARSASAKRERAWSEFTYALTSRPSQVESLKLAAEDHEGTPMEAWSNLTWADYQIAEASGKFFRNRADADKQIKSALTIYESLVDSLTSDLLRDRARLGLARALEMKGELEKARENYEQVGGAFAQIAEARTEALAEPDTDATFAWLRAAVATAPRPPIGPGTPGEKPLFGTDFSPTPPGGPAVPKGAPAPESAPEAAPEATQPTADAETTEEEPVDFSFGESETTTEPAAEPAAEPVAEPAAEPAADAPDASNETTE